MKTPSSIHPSIHAERYHGENINKHPKLLPTRRREENLKRGNSCVIVFVVVWEILNAVSTQSVCAIPPTPDDLSQPCHPTPKCAPLSGSHSHPISFPFPNPQAMRRDPNMNQIITLDWPIWTSFISASELIIQHSEEFLSCAQLSFWFWAQLPHLAHPSLTEAEAKQRGFWVELEVDMEISEASGNNRLTTLLIDNTVIKYGYAEIELLVIPVSNTVRLQSIRVIEMSRLNFIYLL